MTPAEPIAFDTRAERALLFEIAPLVVVLALFFSSEMSCRRRA
jgi:hypothetical protein